MTTPSRPVLLALLLNLVPVVFAALFGWSLVGLMLLYWAENVIVGAINMPKMLLTAYGGKPRHPFSVLFDVPFFVFHYGMFCVVHGVLILVLFNGEPEQSVDDPRNLPMLFLRQVHLDRFLALSLVLLATWHLYRFVFDWVLVRQWRRTDLMHQMFEPYGRIVAVHIAVLVGGFAASLLGNPLVAVLLLALLKTVLEVGATQIAETTASSG